MLNYVNTVLPFILLFSLEKAKGDSIYSEKDTVIIVVERFKDNTEFSIKQSEYATPKDTKKEEIRVYRDKFSHPSYFLYLAHLPIKDHIIRHFKLLELDKFKVIWDKNLSYQDWANLSSEGDKNIYLMVFEDELMHRDRFCYGFQVKAYQVAIHTGAQE
ncbi:hypothetical protein [Cecembia calidifontis]|uniref:Uncharacterized protein n=1 Tax=Cecembia calidifontis TaxID=1187080 RepID=A0A4Q7P8M6_9BACT|nr:hypothetical protein [Cecembia calidifontis]RZS95072.1 hypothetical protein BC751_0587 [Cecembia calidifontis]